MGTNIPALWTHVIRTMGARLGCSVKSVHLSLPTWEQAVDFGNSLNPCCPKQRTRDVLLSSSERALLCVVTGPAPPQGWHVSAPRPPLPQGCRTRAPSLEADTSPEASYALRLQVWRPAPAGVCGDK